MSRRSSVEVMFPATRRVEQWISRHEQGEVPSRWPYGLHGLAEHTGTSRWVELDEPALPLKVGARLGLPALRRMLSPADSIGLTWDENTARRMLLAHPRRRMYSGVIWLTDALATLSSTQRAKSRAILRRMNGVWVLSRAQVEPLREFLGPGGPPVHLVRFGVDQDFYTAHPYPHEPMVVSIGGDRHRDTPTLFAALEEVHRARPEVRIVVQTSSDVAAPRGVEKHAYFTQRQLKDLYRQASVVTIATRSNLHVSGMTVSLEAMSTGRPVVITRTPGMEDYIQDGASGFLTEVGDPEALSRDVVRLLADPALARSMGAAGRAFVEDSGATRHLVDDLARIFV